MFEKDFARLLGAVCTKPELKAALKAMTDTATSFKEHGV